MTTRNQQPPSLEAIVEAIEQGMSLKELKNLSDEALEAIYACAYSLYQASKYEKAKKIFQFLCFYDHYNKKYFLGLAGCQQMMKEFEAAISTYTFACILDSEDPHPPLQAANCHAVLGNYKEAESGYHAAKVFSANKPKLIQIHDFATMREQAMQEKRRAVNA